MRNEGLLAIRREVQARGYFEKAPGRVVGELTLLVGVAAISVGMFIAVDSVVIKTTALVLLALTKVGVSTNTHTSSHYATSDSRRVNEILTYFGFPFFVGLSATYWWHKHVVVHHPAPNVIGVDDDADLLPFFAVNTTELDGISTLRRLYHRVQWLIIPFAIVGNSFSMQFAGWRHLVRALRDPTRRRRAHWIDLSVLLLHGLVWIVMPMMFFSAADVVLFYLVRGGLYSYALFAAIAPAHFPAEALFVDKSSKNVDVVLLQTSTTVNFRTGVIGRLLCAGADHQIEHHLFPGISHVHYPQVSKVVKAYCDAHGYPHRTLGWGEAVMKSLLIFYRAKPVQTLVPLRTFPSRTS